MTLSAVTLSRKLYLAATSDASVSDAYAQASTADGVLSYTLDVSSLHLNTAYLRVTSGSIPLAKVAVITKADSRSAIAAPTDITAALDAKVNNVVHLNWACVDDAASYLIAYTPSGGSASTVQVASDGAQAQSYTLEGLSYGTSYSFTVTARPDPYFCLDSTPASADKSVTTGAQPSGLKVDYINVSMTDATSTPEEEG